MLPGLRAALNYHPMFVHFPIVLWLAALLFQVLALRRSSDEMQRVGTWMLYLGTLNGDKAWVRKDLLKTAVGDPTGKRDPNTPRVNNGITGDARPSTPELGKRIYDMKVDYAVVQMKKFASGQSN